MKELFRRPMTFSWVWLSLLAACLLLVGVTIAASASGPQATQGSFAGGSGSTGQGDVRADADRGITWAASLPEAVTPADALDPVTLWDAVTWTAAPGLTSNAITNTGPTSGTFPALPVQGVQLTWEVNGVSESGASSNSESLLAAASIPNSGTYPITPANGIQLSWSVEGAEATGLIEPYPTGGFTIRFSHSGSKVTFKGTCTTDDGIWKAEAGLAMRLPGDDYYHPHEYTWIKPAGNWSTASFEFTVDGTLCPEGCEGGLWFTASKSLCPHSYEPCWSTALRIDGMFTPFRPQVEGRVTTGLLPTSNSWVPGEDPLAYPLPGALVQLIKLEGEEGAEVETVVGRAITNAQGRYSVRAPIADKLKVRVSLEHPESIYKTADFRVLYQTQSGIVPAVTTNKTFSSTMSSLSPIEIDLAFTGDADVSADPSIPRDRLQSLGGH